VQTRIEFLERFKDFISINVFLRVAFTSTCDVCAQIRLNFIKWRTLVKHVQRMVEVFLLLVGSLKLPGYEKPHPLRCGRLIAKIACWRISRLRKSRVCCHCNDACRNDRAQE